MDESRNSRIKITRKPVKPFLINIQKRTYFTKVLGFQKASNSKNKTPGFQLKKYKKINNFKKIFLSKFVYKNLNTRQSLLFTLILDKLNINLPEGASSHVNFAFGIFILSLICLFNFINVVGYLTSIYLLNKYDIETKFPKFKKIIRYFEKRSLFWVFIEGLTCVIFLICIIIFSLIEIGIPVLK